MHHAKSCSGLKNNNKDFLAQPPTSRLSLSDGRAGFAAVRASGFTLIEIAIVLIIIGLLLGGVLKGTELINSAKVKSLAADFQNTQVAILGYQDKYRALPGDDGTAHDGRAADLNPPKGNGVINGGCGSVAVTDESALVWRDLRAGGFVTGEATAGAYQTNSAGGKICVVSSATIASLANVGMPGSLRICSRGIPADLAERVDRQLDDGLPASGSMRALVDGEPDTATVIPNPAAGAATGGYQGAGVVTLCQGF